MEMSIDVWCYDAKQVKANYNSFYPDASNDNVPLSTYITHRYTTRIE